MKAIITFGSLLSLVFFVATPSRCDERANRTRPFKPNPTLAGLADNTTINLGAFQWEKPAGEAASGSVTDYSGMTYDPHNNRILLFGGGHATTWTDAIYAFSFTTLKWTVLYSPTPAKFYKKENMDRGFWKAGAEGNYPRPVRQARLRPAGRTRRPRRTAPANERLRPFFGRSWLRLLGRRDRNVQL